MRKLKRKLEDRFSEQIQSLSKELLGVTIPMIANCIDPIEKKTKVYVPWLLNQMSPKKFGTNRIRLPEDSIRVITVLKQFNQLQRQLPSNDINQYDFRTLEQEVDKLQGNVFKSKREEERDIKLEGVEDYRESENYKIVKITTPKAASLLAKNTKWCTSNTIRKKSFSWR